MGEVAYRREGVLLQHRCIYTRFAKKMSHQHPVRDVGAAGLLYEEACCCRCIPIVGGERDGDGEDRQVDKRWEDQNCPDGGGLKISERRNATVCSCQNTGPVQYLTWTYHSFGPVHARDQRDEDEEDDLPPSTPPRLLLPRLERGRSLRRTDEVKEIEAAFPPPPPPGERPADRFFFCTTSLDFVPRTIRDFVPSAPRERGKPTEPLLQKNNYVHFGSQVQQRFSSFSLPISQYAGPSLVPFCRLPLVPLLQQARRRQEVRQLPGRDSPVAILVLFFLLLVVLVHPSQAAARFLSLAVVLFNSFGKSGKNLKFSSFERKELILNLVCSLTSHI